MKAGAGAIKFFQKMNEINAEDFFIKKIYPEKRD